MVWIYLAESEECRLPCEIGSDLLPIVTTIDTPNLCCSQGCKKDQFLMRQFGTTSRRLVESFYQKSTSSTEDFHARTLVSLELESAYQESEAGYFLRYVDWLRKQNRNSFFWKTCQRLGLVGLNEWEKNWPASGMIVDGVLFPLEKLGQTTEEKDGLCWRTPDTCQGGTLSREALQTLSEKYRDTGVLEREGGKKHTLRLQDQVRSPLLWPTPMARDWKDNGSPNEMKRNTPSLASVVANQSRFPTPTVRDSADNPMPPRKPNPSGGQKPPLLTVIGGKLNPTWVEWLMNYRTGWTELNASGMQLFHSKRKKRSRS